MSDHKNRRQDIQQALLQGERVSLTWEEYISLFRGKERMRAVQMAIDEAGAAHAGEAIREEAKV